MKPIAFLWLAALPLTAVAGDSIEGYWQDVARRILFSRDAPAGYEYGRWGELDPNNAYPSAKAIRRIGDRYEVTDLLYDDEYTIDVRAADERRVDFTRSWKFDACTMSHACRLEGGDTMVCRLEDACRDAGGSVVRWRGEERYARRAHCERDGGKQQQGIPVKCR